MKKTNGQLNGQKLKSIIIQFSDVWAQKIKDQRDVLTFHDGTIQQALTMFLQNIESIPWHKDLDDILLVLQQFTSRENAEAFISNVVNWYYGRFVDYDTRTKPGTNSPNLDFLRRSERDRSFSMSQGRFDCLTWKDTILFKSVFDLGIYQMMLWELKPKTIIEIGSGTGGSAIWMSDLMTTFNLDCKIISVDITPPAIQYENVTFLKGDCTEIEAALDAQMLNQLPRPWLVIEDAHANVLGVLNYLHQFLKQGDYLNIEDSFPKQEEIAAFIENKKGSYMVDTLYCDFFGRNVTCSWDSIFRKE